MSDSSELLALRLALTGTIFVFVLIAAITMRSGLRPSGTGAASTANGGRRARLIVVKPGETGLPPGTAFALAGQMTVGRDPGNSIVLVDASVSNRHASVERAGDSWRVMDLGSTNGTFVRGQRVDRRGLPLQAGDVLSIGTVTLRVDA